METQTLQHQHANRATGAVRLVAYAGAAAFAIAAAWFWLAVKGVTVSPAPRTGPDMPAQQAMRIYYHWQATTLPQERYYFAIAIAGFLCLAACASSVQGPARHDRAPARIGPLFVSTGCLLWIAGYVLVLGGHRAVGLMAAHANPIQATNSIAFTIDTISQAFAVAAFALIGAGMLALAAAIPGHRAQLGCTIGTALVMLITAASYASGSDNFSDLMLFISGLLALPLWLIGTGRISSFRTNPASSLR